MDELNKLVQQRDFLWEKYISLKPPYQLRKESDPNLQGAFNRRYKAWVDEREACFQEYASMRDRVLDYIKSTSN